MVHDIIYTFLGDGAGAAPLQPSIPGSWDARDGLLSVAALSPGPRNIRARRRAQATWAARAASACAAISAAALAPEISWTRGWLKRLWGGACSSWSSCFVAARLVRPNTDMNELVWLRVQA
jgi:hypothetical protein